MSGLSRLDAVGQAELVARGEVSPSELVEAAIARIEAMNPLIHAVVAFDPERARKLEAPAGPFRGVPFLIKDLNPYPGLRWALGSRLFLRNMPAPATPYCTRIDESGLITLGKTATSEFGLLGSTETLFEGVTHNPWDLSYSAAGSSGGAAAAVAAGMVPFAHASDGGGSVRIPASVCGLFGFKPSKGRTVPAVMQGNDFSELASDHVITRSVRDSALFLSATETGGLGYVREPIARRLKIATFTRTLIGTEPEPAVRRAYDEAIALCTELGHDVVPIAPPPVDGDALGDAFFLVAGGAMAGLFAIIPQMRGRPIEQNELEPFTRSLVEWYQSRGSDALGWARTQLAEAARAYLQAIAGYDVVLTPTLATRPWPLGHLSPIVPREELLRRTAESVGYTPIHNIAGCPAMSVPLHWSDEGLPIGTHFAAAPGNDALLFGLAYQLEQARPWRDQWAPWSYPRLFEA